MNFTILTTLTHSQQRLPCEVQFGVQRLAQEYLNLQPGDPGESNQQPSKYWMIRSTSWASAAPSQVVGWVIYSFEGLLLIFLNIGF